MKTKFKFSFLGVFLIFSLASLPAVHGQNCKFLVDSLLKRVEKGDLLDILPLAFYTDSVCLLEVGENDTLYAEAVNILASGHFAAGKKVEALSFFKKALDLSRLARGTYISLQCAQSWAGISQSYIELGKIPEGLSAIDSAIFIAEKVIGNSNINFGKFLNTKAQILLKAGRLTEALPFAQMALENSEKNNNPEDYSLSVRLTTLGFIEATLGEISKAAEHFQRAKVLNKKLFGENHLNYLIVNMYYALLKVQTGDFLLAEKPLEEVVNALLQNPDASPQQKSIFQSNLGICKIRIGKYDEAIAIFEGLRQEELTNANKNPIEFARFLINLSTAYYEVGDTHLAFPLLLEVKNLLSAGVGLESLDNIIASQNLASCYLFLGDLETAYLHAREGHDISERVFGVDFKETVSSQQKLAVILSGMGKRKEAIRLLQDAILSIEESANEDNLFRGRLYHSLANQLYFDKQYEESKTYIDKAINIFKKTIGAKTPEYNLTYLVQARVFSETGKMKKAIRSFQKALVLVNSRENDSFNSIIAQEYANLIEKRDPAKAYQLQLQSIDQLRSKITQNFLVLSESGRMSYAQQISTQLDIWNSFCFRNNSRYSDVPGHLFDNELFQKGQSLASANVVNASIRDSGDSTLQNDFVTWRNNRQVLAHQQSLDPDKRLFKPEALDSLARDTDLREALLAQNSAVFREARQQVSWNQVRESLRPDEVAIEFIHFQYYQGKSTDSTLYCALVLRPGYEMPKLVPLFEEKQLEYILRQNTDDSEQYVDLVYRGPELYRLIWQPLDSLLAGVKKIYYSPSGLMHRISFCAIAKHTRGPLLVDQYDLQLVSSTRELVIGKERLYTGTDMQSALIYGGILYETDSLKMTEALDTIVEDFRSWLLDSVNLTNIKLRLGDDIWQELNKSLRRSSEVRGSQLQFLKGSLREAALLEAFLKSREIRTLGLSEYKALEESFKLLGVLFPSPDIIHISTHGFFLPDPVRKKEDTDKPITFADNPLFRSGLHFAGSINAWQKKPLLAGFDDGILYAYEIAGMDLSNTKLVILSACETGLGDIVGGEGVYGLQRAFNLAGVEHIIMSLWKISDDATVEFMETFYRHWLSEEENLDIREAFARTQQEMRKKYKDPYYWAAFVLI